MLAEAGKHLDAGVPTVACDKGSENVNSEVDELIEAGDLHEIQNRGRVRTVGRDHEFCDGDVVEFFFSG